MENMPELFHFLFSFEGRLSRRDYWVKFAFPLFLISIGFGIIDFLVQSEILSTIFSTLLLIPTISRAVKRLHDRGYSGWLVLLMIIPFVNIWLLIEIMFLKGNYGQNQYGPDPLGFDYNL